MEMFEKKKHFYFFQIKNIQQKDVLVLTQLNLYIFNKLRHLSIINYFFLSACPATFADKTYRNNIYSVDI